MRRLARLTLACLVLAGCGRRSEAAESGKIVSVEPLTGRVELFEPIEAVAGAGGVYVLDRGNSILIRLGAGGAADTLVREGQGPGELRRPTVFAVSGDTLLAVADEGNARIQLIRPGRPGGRTIQYGKGAQGGDFDLAGGRFYAAAYGQNFALFGRWPSINQDSLVTVVSLEDGRILREFGTPRPYRGTVAPIIGNLVRVALNPVTSELWVAWPLETHLERFDSTGKSVGSMERELLFEAPEMEEYRTKRSPLPGLDAQLLTYDIAFDEHGRLHVLTAIEEKEGIPDDPDFETPAQAVEIYDAQGKLQCRLPLSFAATTLSVAPGGDLLLSDMLQEPAVYRVRHRCNAA